MVNERIHETTARFHKKKQIKNANIPKITKTKAKIIQQTRIKHKFTPIIPILTNIRNSSTYSKKIFRYNIIT